MDVEYEDMEGVLAELDRYEWTDDDLSKVLEWALYRKAMLIAESQGKKVKK